MPRSRRRRILLNALTTLCTLLSLATLVPWIRSHRGGESIHWNSPTTDPPTVSREFEAYSDDGLLTVFWGRSDYPPLTPDERDRWREWWDLRDRPVGWRYVGPARYVSPGGQVKPGPAGFGYGHASGDYRAPWAPAKTVKARGTYLIAPYWFLATVLAVPLLLRTFALLRHHLTRPTPGRCPTCNYDLRATPDRCPECGTITIP